ncbi:14096_t:CDS:2, partial [Ambispora leptoticha]
MTKHGSFLSRFQNLDAYAKTLDDFRVRTYYGAALLSFDVIDSAGEAYSDDLTHDIYKTRLDVNGNHIEKEKAKELGDSTKGIEKFAPKQLSNDTTADGNSTEKECGSCYGGEEPPSGCCNTCEEVREAYMKKGWSFGTADKIDQCVKEGWVDKIKKQSKEGCNVHGTFSVNKVAGNFHFAPGKSFQQNHVHIHDLQAFLEDFSKHDFSHTIHHLSYGPIVDGVINPLDGVVRLVEEGNYQYQYFHKVVATQFHYLNKTSVYTNQYSVTQFERNLSDQDEMKSHSSGLPGVWFYYQISPMLIINREQQKSFTHFLTGVCAIVGGIFTVAGILDGFIYNAEKTLKKKMELGKHLGRTVQLVMGPAGSGKSTYCATMMTHCQTVGRSIHLMNLDPAAERFEYKPSIDIRDLITLEDVMEELHFGPNGGLIYCL